MHANTLAPEHVEPPNLGVALAHAARGRRVFPCCPRTKRPAIAKRAGGNGFKDATTEAAQLRQWWAQYPDSIVGMPTGAQTGVFVVDIDVKAGKVGELTFEQVLETFGPLPETIESQTATGGRHLFFKHPRDGREVPSKASRMGTGAETWGEGGYPTVPFSRAPNGQLITPDLDIRGDGGYVILPGSKMLDGTEYGWEGSSDPDEGAQIADAPAWLLALVCRDPDAIAHPGAAGHSPTDPVAEGGRNDFLYRLGCSLRAKGLTEGAIIAALIAENSARCQPPLPEPEVIATAKSAAAKPPGLSPEYAAKAQRKPTLTVVDNHPNRPPEDPWTQPPGDLSDVGPAIPYPAKAFPEVARHAIWEYQAFGQQPMAMVGSSALAQMALAAQPLANVARNRHLVGPVSLNLMVFGESGERKTAADRQFGRAARQWQEEQREERRPAHLKSVAMAKAHGARIDSIKKKLIAEAAKDSEESKTECKRLEERLVELQQNEVYVQPLPTLTYEDATPAALQYSIATGWPSCGLFSDEAGAVVGSHGMGEDTATSLLALLNILWDGRSFHPTRKQAATAELKGRRVSAFLMLQPHLFATLIERGARSIGFVARFLISAPKSTMGTRLYVEPPDEWQELEAFDRAILRLLDQPLPIDDSAADKGIKMTLAPPVMALDAGAKLAYIHYHDEVERELATFGDLANVRDIAAKSAENACRIATVFQLFDQGEAGERVAESFMLAGIQLARWHLLEARRLFEEIAAPQHIADARELSSWLRIKARDLTDSTGAPILSDQGEIALRDISRLGPNPIRETPRRDAAIEALEEANHLRRCDSGKQKRVQLHPKLLNP